MLLLLLYEKYYNDQKMGIMYNQLKCSCQILIVLSAMYGRFFYPNACSNINIKWTDRKEEERQLEITLEHKKNKKEVGKQTSKNI